MTVGAFKDASQSRTSLVLNPTGIPCPRAVWSLVDLVQRETKTPLVVMVFW